MNFYGVKTHLGETLAEFDVSTELNHASASQFLTGSNKQFFIGADRLNITGSLITPSDAKFARFMVWNSYITNDEIKKHSRNPKNYGLSNPHQNAFSYENAELSSSFIIKADTLSLNWEFDDYEYDGGSINYYYDSTDASMNSPYESDNIKDLFGKNHRAKLSPKTFSTTAEAKSFATRYEYMQSAIIHRPDSLYGKNMVRVLRDDYSAYQKNKKPVKHFFAFEASRSEVISRDMLNFFSDVVSFNNLYGEPVQAFRDNYNQLEQFKRFYFEKIDTVADLDKFVNLYKFLDNALDSVIKNLVPASAATSEKIRTVVEDHVLDRHKYKRQYNLLIQRIADISDPKAGLDQKVEFDGNEDDHVPDVDDLNSNNIGQVTTPTS